MINEFYANKFCKDDITKIENYEKAMVDNETWVIHHRLETHYFDGTKRPIFERLTRQQLKTYDLYYNRPAAELIFMTKHDHMFLHMKGAKRVFSDEWRQHISEAQKGKHHSEAAKSRISNTLKGRPCPNKGKHWKLINGKRVYY